ncbi:MAG: NAD-glutamate dehydrogenase [Methylococcales bacterium]|nr:NAD-glutamate dehydrogenase [Methylococcales bacterium]
MTYKTEQEFLKRLLAYIKTKLSEDTIPLMNAFATQYYQGMVIENFESDNSIEDWYAALLSHWNLLLNATPHNFCVQVYNPTLEEHSWQSQHTIVEIVMSDRPFLLQSVCMEINRHGFTNHLVIHPVFNFKRDEQGKLLGLAEMADDNDISTECLLHVEIDRQSNQTAIDELKASLNRILKDVQAATDDWKKCLDTLQSVINELKTQQHASPHPLGDSIAFLQWLHDNHFVFLGYREYQLVDENKQKGLKIISDTGLGVLHDSVTSVLNKQTRFFPPETYDYFTQPSPLIITKATTRATVHRSVFMDYIGIKQYNSKGDVIGEKRFLGLYSSSAYSCDLRKIPMISHKLQHLKERSGFRANTYGARALLYILQSLPRDELFQADEQSLFECAMGVLQLQESQRVRVFVRHDVYGHFISLLTFVPRDRYHTQSRKKIQSILLETFKGENVDFSVQLSESILARIHFIIHSNKGCCTQYDLKALEQKIVEALAEWKDDLQIQLNHYFGEAKGNTLFYNYCDGFSAAYREETSTRTALLDIGKFEQLIDCNLHAESLLYSPLTVSGKKTLRFKLFNRGQQASLSKSLPMLENMGIKVCDERPYEIKNKNSEAILWLHDFGLDYEVERSDLDLARLKPRFETAFEQCWFDKIENDGFNALILNAKLKWEQVNLFRALYLYLRQLGMKFSQTYVELTLSKNPQVVSLLFDFFNQRFNPDLNQQVKQLCEISLPVEEAIEQVSSLDEDRILRHYLNLIHAAVRTNYFSNLTDEQGFPFFAIKFDSALINEMPAPVPYFEIFVYSPRVEGIHLRGGAVARGGIRWSDRREDFRTEILGLMKAQMTKNALIVPTGAKGGFVVKRLHKITDKDKIYQEVIQCYQIFIQSLLTLTDNKQDGLCIKPKEVVCYDGNDPYLVVAADKGTAKFSDYANQLSQQADFWLGDAFASGGSVGYDHKVMGITARGAWESVKHHFSQLNLNTTNTPFTVVGIGGMLGDVFGNGMLLSSQIKLVATFDHLHIFLDPNPDPANSFKERQRLFQCPKSSWQDYDADLISTGGGVFLRNLKSIAISPQVQKCLNIRSETLTPHELIRAILSAPVDLLWNGGIGTYVKAHDESNIDVGDKANDAVRVNGKQLQCKVVAEGGNLGFTQKGRIEYAQQGGYCNTDSIDNSAGVDCSDHEVNIKILLNGLMRKGDLTEKQRNQLLEAMTEEVANKVLVNNYQQNQVISLIESHSSENSVDSQLLIKALEDRGHLNRPLESIPSDSILKERHTQSKGLTRPEISVLLAYSKQLMKQELLKELTGLDKKLFFKTLQAYFPAALQQKYPEEIQQHSLRDEIVANGLVNQLINRMGMVLPYRLMEETGCSTVAIINIDSLVCEVFNVDILWEQLESQTTQLNKEVFASLKMTLRKAIEKAMYWFIDKDRQQLGLFDDRQDYIEGIKALNTQIASFMTQTEQKWIDEQVDNFIHKGVAAEVAIEIVVLDVLYWCLDVVWLKKQTRSSLQDCAIAFFQIIDAFDLLWLRQQINDLPKNTVWESLARRTVKKEFNNVCCRLTIVVLQQSSLKVNDKLAACLKLSNTAITRYRKLVSLVKTDKDIELEKITVLLKELVEINMSMSHHQ